MKPKINSKDSTWEGSTQVTTESVVQAPDEDDYDVR
jgi:hypothetical protein